MSSYTEMAVMYRRAARTSRISAWVSIGASMVNGISSAVMFFAVESRLQGWLYGAIALLFLIAAHFARKTARTQVVIAETYDRMHESMTALEGIRAQLQQRHD
jgi:hypothetical protein